MVVGNKPMEARPLTSDFYEQVKGRLYQRIAQELRSAERVLDIGCGSCTLARFLSERNHQQVIGVDLHDGSFPHEVAADSEIQCLKADASRMDFLQDASVDAAVTLYALHEMNRPITVLREVRRVLQLTGEMLVLDHLRDSLAQRIWNESYYTAEEVEKLLRRSGFLRVEVDLIERSQIIWARGYLTGG